MTAAPPDPAQSRWDVVTLAILGGIMVGLVVGKVPPAMAEIGTDLGLDRVTAGWLASLFFAVGAGFAVIGGMLGSRTGARAMVTGGLLVMVIGAVIGTFAPSAGLLLASRVIEGIGFATVAVAAPKIIVDATRPADRDIALGIWSVFMPAGMALAMLATPLLLGGIGWRGVWLVSAAAVLAVALLIVAGTGRRRWPGPCSGCSPARSCFTPSPGSPSRPGCPPSWSKPRGAAPWPRDCSRRWWWPRTWAVISRAAGCYRAARPAGA